MSGEYIVSKVKITDLIARRTYLELYEKKRELVAVLKSLRCKESYDEIIKLNEEINNNRNKEEVEKTFEDKKNKNKLLNVFDGGFIKNKCKSILDGVLNNNKFDFSKTKIKKAIIPEMKPVENLEDKLIRLKQEFFSQYNMTFESFGDYVTIDNNYFVKNNLLSVKQELNDILSEMLEIERTNHDLRKRNDFEKKFGFKKCA